MITINQCFAAFTLAFSFRLNMSQSFSQSTVKSSPRKRRRDEGQSTFVQEAQQTGAYASSGTVLGSMEICEVSEEGKYIKIRNMADKVGSAYCLPHGIFIRGCLPVVCFWDELVTLNCVKSYEENCSTMSSQAPFENCLE